MYVVKASHITNNHIDGFFEITEVGTNDGYFTMQVSVPEGYQPHSCGFARYWKKFGSVFGADNQQKWVAIPHGHYFFPSDIIYTIVTRLIEETY